MNNIFLAEQITNHIRDYLDSLGEINSVNDIRDDDIMHIISGDLDYGSIYSAEYE